MTLTTVPKNIYRVQASGHGTAVFTTRAEARQYRRILRNKGVSNDAMTTTRFVVSDGQVTSV